MPNQPSNNSVHSILILFIFQIFQSSEQNIQSPTSTSVSNNDENLSSSISEQSIGYFDGQNCPTNCTNCDSLSQCTSCELGYFLFQVSNTSLCLLCPGYKLNNIQCGNCIDYSMIWQKTLKCNYSYININPDSQILLKNETETKLYIVKEDNQGNLYTQECENCESIQSLQNSQTTLEYMYKTIICKSGYTWQNDTCMACPLGCSSCSFSQIQGNQTCLSCLQGYYLEIPGICLSCPMQYCTQCVHSSITYVSLSLDELIYLKMKNSIITRLSQSEIDLLQSLTQRYSSQSYISVGIYCLNCLYPKILTGDLKNCSLCTDQIANCAQCYYAKSASSLDDTTLKPGVKMQSLSAINGPYCAICQTGYTVSSDRLQCIQTDPIKAQQLQNCKSFRMIQINSSYECIECSSSYVLSFDQNGYGYCLTITCPKTQCSNCYHLKLPFTSTSTSPMGPTSNEQILPQQISLGCTKYCVTCSSDPNMCTLCTMGYYGLPLCKSTCSYKCKACSKSNDPDLCDICADIRSGTPTCNCPSGTYDDGVNANCQDCSQICRECNGQANQCTSCYNNVNRELVGSKCNCQQGYQEFGFKACIQIGCDYTCESCQSAGSCSSCSKESQRQLNLKTQQCDCYDGYYDSNELICKQCLKICKSCTNGNSCQQCADGNDPLKQCLTCKNGYFQLDDGSCEACISTCSQCQNKNSKCTQCRESDFRELISETCVCKNGYKDTGSTVCEIQTVCTICQDQYYLDISTWSCLPCSLCSQCEIPVNLDTNTLYIPHLFQNFLHYTSNQNVDFTDQTIRTAFLGQISFSQTTPICTTDTSSPPTCQTNLIYNPVSLSCISSSPSCIDETCQSCDYLQGKVICLTCSRGLNNVEDANQAKCISCQQNGCIQCRTMNEQQIYSVNPYYNYLSYTPQSCLQIDSSQTNIFYNSRTTQSYSCSNIRETPKGCSKFYQFDIYIQCVQNQQSSLENYINVPQSAKTSTSTLQLLGSLKISENIYKEMNENHIEEVVFNINLLTMNGTAQCILNPDIVFSVNFFQKVFPVKTVTAFIRPVQPDGKVFSDLSSGVVKFYLGSRLLFEGFTNIIFQNVNFYYISLSASVFSTTKNIFGIQAQALGENGKMILNNSQIQGDDSQFQISLTDFTNVQFQSVNFSNIIEQQANNTGIPFILLDQSSRQNITLTMDQIHVSNVKLYLQPFFSIQGYSFQQIKVGLLNISQISIEQASIFSQDVQTYQIDFTADQIIISGLQVFNAQVFSFTQVNSLVINEINVDTISQIKEGSMDDVLFISNRLVCKKMNIQGPFYGFIIFQITSLIQNTQSQDSPDIDIQNVIINNLDLTVSTLFNFFKPQSVSYRYDVSLRNITIQGFYKNIVDLNGIQTACIILVENVDKFAITNFSVNEYSAFHRFIDLSQVDKADINGLYYNNNQSKFSLQFANTSQSRNYLQKSLIKAKSITQQLILRNIEFSWICTLNQPLINYVEPEAVFSTIISADQKNPSLTYNTVDSQIIIQNVSIQGVMLYQDSSKQYSSLISIQLESQVQVYFTNVSFQQIQKKTQTDLMILRDDSAAIQLTTPFCIVFFDGLIVNSTWSDTLNSPIIIKSQGFIMNNSIFNNNTYPQGESSGVQFIGWLVGIFNTAFTSGSQNKFGAIKLVGTQSSQITMDNTSFTNITSRGQGASLYVSFLSSSGNLNIQNSQFLNNTAYQQAASIFVSSPTQIVTISISNTYFLNQVGQTSGILYFVQSLQMGSSISISNTNISHSSDYSYLQNVLQNYSSQYIYSIFVNTINSLSFNQTTISNHFLFSVVQIQNAQKFELNNSKIFNNSISSISNAFQITNGKMFFNIMIKSSIKNITIYGKSEAYFNLNQNENIYVSNFTMSNIQCMYCIQSNLYIKSSKNVYMEFLNIQNCVSQNYGIIQITGISNTLTGRLLQTNAGTLSNVQIVNSKFQSNEGGLGGALYGENIQLNLTGSSFISNKARQGGGFYLTFSNISLELQPYIGDCDITNNSAQIGGGYRSIGLDAWLYRTTVNQNQATQYGADTFVYPNRLMFTYNNREYLQSINMNSSSNLEVGEPLVSGGVAKKIFIQLALSDGGIITEDQNNSISQVRIASGQDSTANVQGTTESQWNDNLKGFEFENLEFRLNPTLQTDLIVQFGSSAIKIPVYNLNGQITSYTTYVLRVQFPIRQCIIGEQLISSTGICSPCENDFYNLNLGDTCKKCLKPQMSLCPGKNLTYISSGYWRLHNLTDIITECSNMPSNCLGGSLNFTCVMGNLGPLCETCDLYGLTGSSYTNEGDYICVPCSNQSSSILKFLALSVYTLISMFVSVFSATDSIIIQATLAVAQKLGFIGNRQANVQNQSGILIKMLINYLQILGALIQLGLKFTTNFSFALNTTGNPIKTMSFSLDCFLAGSTTMMDIIYLRMVLSIILPIMFLLIFFMMYSSYNYLRKKRQDIGVYYTAILYMFLYVQPNVIQGLIDLASQREIGGISYVKASIDHEYSTTTHYKYLIALVLPSLLMFLLLIPIILFLKLFFNQDRLDQIRNKMKWGYLYNEYKIQTYFWAFVKMFVRIAMIVVLSFYQDYIIVKGIFIYLFLFIYSLMSQLHRPFQNKSLNSLDETQTNVCMISIIVGVFIYKNPLDYLQTIGYLILGIINLYYIVLLLRGLLASYSNKFEDKIKTCKIVLIRFMPFLKTVLKVNTADKQKIYNYWKLIRLTFNDFKENRKQYQGQQFTFTKVQAKDIIPQKRGSESASFQEEPLSQSGNTPQQEEDRLIPNKKTRQFLLSEHEDNKAKLNSKKSNRIVPIEEPYVDQFIKQDHINQQNNTETQKKSVEQFIKDLENLNEKQDIKQH